MAVSSVGDIVILSQLAWRVARAFKTGGSEAPSDFLDIYNEADGLSESLRLLAETLHRNGDLLKSADLSLRQAVATILQSTRTTLEDLDSLTDRYRVVRKIITQGGFVVEKHWSDIVLANYKQMIWTAEKGDLQALRNMLRMHANTISLTTHALQSKSIVEIEKMVVPVANTVDGLHDTVDESLLGKLDDVHRIIAGIGHAPSARTPPIRQSEASHILRQGSTSTASTGSESPSQRFKRLPYQGTGLPSPPSTPRSRHQSSSRSRRPSSLANALSASSFDAKDYRVDDEPTTLHSRQEDDNFDEYLESMSMSDRDIGSFDSKTYEPQVFDSSPLHEARRDSETISPSLLARTSVTPSSPIDLDSTYGYRSSGVPTSASSSSSKRASTADRPETSMSRRTEDTVLLEQKRVNFMKQLFRNSAKLFDGHADLVEFTQDNAEEPDPRFATELVPVATGCRVLVVRKKENLPHGGLTYTTSIWTIADDFSVRAQQRLPDYPESVPWSSYFSPEKVSLSGDIILHHHGHTWGDPILTATKTNWINYIFEPADAATNFQSAIFGRKLLQTFKTEKTTVHHQGLRAAFAFEEQMCGIETLRLWEEDGVSLPGAGGGVLALIHFSPSFGESWCQFWINSSRHPVRISNDSGRYVKIRDIDIGVIHVGARKDPSSNQRRTTQKKVTGMRIEFSSLEEKGRFLEFCGRVRERLIPLPDCRVSGETIR